MLTIDIIKQCLQTDLPGEIAHRIMLPEGRCLLTTGINENDIKQSAVLALLINDREELKLCLTRRSANLKHHPGQISFPGGALELNETAIITAYRETEEENGINTNEIQYLGNLSELYIPVSNFKIFPIVAYLDQMPNFNINKDEVHEIILPPLKAFMTTDSIVSQEIQTSNGSITAPCFLIDNRIIWGATAMMIAELATILKKHY